MKANKEEEEKPLRFLKLIEKPVPRPPTPQINIPDLVSLSFNLLINRLQFNALFLKEEEEKDLAIIYLQKIIRGKAIQNMVILIIHIS